MGFATFFGTASSIFAEAKVIWLGLFFAQKLGFQHRWIESGCEALVKFQNSSSISIWSIELYILNDFLIL